MSELVDCGIFVRNTLARRDQEVATRDQGVARRDQEVATGDQGVARLDKKPKEYPPSQVQRRKGHPLCVYACGPTVYSEAHLGHARTYTSLDIMRRIMSDYFRIPVMWCMNVTDVDDKIINEFNKGETGFASVFEYSKDREASFFAGMDALNVRRPDSLLRVSEVVPEIVDFVKELVSRGFAYQQGSDVYFDVPKYNGTEGFAYAELEPESFSAANRQGSRSAEPGKGTGVDLATREKRSEPDFVLWKGAKEGEPSWPSPWGPGRPGWHIECSTMSRLFFGDQFDVHCGGIDLRFPHHTNEIAQSQARSGVAPWVRAWWHTGQLMIGEEKMSKSLANFKSIKQALEAHPWRSLRMAFAMKQWDSSMRLTDQGVNAASSTLSKITNFLQQAECMLATGASGDVHAYSDKDRRFAAQLGATGDRVRAAFAHNFDVPDAISAILELVKEANLEPAPNGALLVAAARFVSHIMDVLGFNKETGAVSGEATNLKPVAVVLAAFRCEARSNARAMLSDVRVARGALGSGEVDAAMKALEDRVKRNLALLDAMRNVTLPALGIYLEDAKDGSVTFKLYEAKKMSAKPAARAKPAPKLKAAPVAKEVEHPAEVFQAQTDK